MVWNIAFRVGNSGAKETFLIDSFCSDCFSRLSIKHDLDRARVRAKDPDLQIVTNPVRTQHAERVRMNSCDEPLYFVTRQRTDLKSFHTFSCTIKAIKRIHSHCNVGTRRHATRRMQYLQEEE